MHRGRSGSAEDQAVDPRGTGARRGRAADALHGQLKRSAGNDLRVGAYLQHAWCWRSLVAHWAILHCACSTTAPITLASWACPRSRAVRRAPRWNIRRASGRGCGRSAQPLLYDAGFCCHCGRWAVPIRGDSSERGSAAACPFRCRSGLRERGRLRALVPSSNERGCVLACVGGGGRGWGGVGKLAGLRARYGWSWPGFWAGG